MPNKSYTGISFPFRLGVRGGIAMSDTSVDNIPHIYEAIQQILQTSEFERTMEHGVYSEVDSVVFEPNDTSTHTLLKYQIQKALEKLEPRVEIKGIEITSDKRSIFANLSVFAKEYNAIYTITVKVGDT